MWTRELLKTNAKQALQGRYWRSFWICLVLSFVGAGRGRGQQRQCGASGCQHCYGRHDGL